ncbi:L-threonylcarbamoyladenylate synthase [Tumidithrix elongata RA019]|uniref:L-threonylcarbamoyladenylate synthase n=1 Tax=Tumidithrix elongata BACA0141 TaxID=2716417 RepID=A0AAW9PRT9_9CYAN|nr:L-threonylcarbamoyladenylate synthase [Tumidithrix elongata RA019]
MALVSLAALVAGARSGKLVSFPTDTVPALAAIASRTDEIFALKQRPKDKPLILMAARLDELLRFVDTEHAALPLWRKVAKQYLPGALTLVLPANFLGRQLNPGFDTIGVRIPEHPIALALLQQTGALLTTSANQSGQPPMRKMLEISNYFPEVLVLGDRFEHGLGKEENLEIATGSGSPSTVAEWTDTGWQIRRQGSVKLSETN